MSTPLPSESPSAPPPPDRGPEAQTEDALRQVKLQNEELRATNQALHERVQRLVSRLQEAGSQPRDTRPLSQPGLRAPPED